MKKRVFAIFVALCLVCSLAACSSGGSGAATQTPSSAAESDGTPTQSGEAEAAPQEGAGEESTEEPVSEYVADSYGLTVEQFTALRAAVQAHLDSEWDAGTAYIDGESSIDLAGACDAVRLDLSEALMEDAAMESYIANELDMSHYRAPTDLWKERITVLAHAVNDWAAQQNVDYETYSNVWDKLADYFIIYNMAADDSGLAPLFPLGSE